MISIRGIFQDGKITMICPSSQTIPEISEVLVTFVDSSEEDISDFAEDEREELVQVADNSRDDDADFESMRQFERVKARGYINIIDQSRKFRFRLNDYSQGGLSFISDWKYETSKIISAGIADPNDKESILMELEMEVRGVFEEEGEGFKIGCMFVDPVDEDLWHGLLPYLA